MAVKGLNMMRKLGFSLGEVLIAVVIIAVMTAVVVPTIMYRIQIANASALRQQLTNLTTAVYQFRNDVGEYPLTLRQLTNVITTGDQNSCGTGNNYVASDIAKWKGPYLSYVTVTTNGMQSVDGSTVENQFTRSPGTIASGLPGYLIVTVSDIEKDLAWKLDSLVDPNPNIITSLGTGTVLWQAAGGVGTIGNLTYYIAIRGC